LKLDRTLLLYSMLFFACAEFFLIPFAGHMSDRIGRKRQYLIGAAATIVLSFVFFMLLDLKQPLFIFAAALVGALAHSTVYGPQAALIAEQFTPRMRYSGASIGYQLASIIAGGPAPLVATWLFSIYKTGTAVATYMAICAAIAFVAVSLMKDYSGKDISQEYDHVPLKE
jgi:MFS family permease